ncbi:MAG: SCO family protein [Bacteroidetes bacterium]|nr:SCO family protein [Bacteroidota bacterium]
MKKFNLILTMVFSALELPFRPIYTLSRILNMNAFFLGLMLLLFNVSLIQAVPSAQQDTTQLQIGITEKTGQFLPLDAVFLNEYGDSVNLRSMIDKPTVIAFVYFDCPGICSPLLDGVSRVVSKANMEIGTEYQVITISIDSVDTPAKALQKKQNFAEKVQKPGIKDGWHFLTGTNANIHKVTNSVGFGYRRQGKDFVHSAAIVVVSPHAKITRYLFGTYFLPFDLKMAIVEADAEKTGPTINKVLSFCFNYDPAGRKYVMNITRITGTIIFSLVTVMFVVLVFKPKKKKEEGNKE